MCRNTHFSYYNIDMHTTQRVCRQICVKLCFYLIILEFLRFLLCKEGTKRPCGKRSPAGRRGRRPPTITFFPPPQAKKPPHNVGRWPSKAMAGGALPALPRLQLHPHVHQLLIRPVPLAEPARITVNTQPAAHSRCTPLSGHSRFPAPSTPAKYRCQIPRGGTVCTACPRH